VLDEHAAAGARHAADAVDRAGALTPVLQDDLQRLAGLLGGLDLANVRDEAFQLQDLGDVLLEVGRRDQRLLVTSERRVANARQHVGDRIGHHGVTS